MFENIERFDVKNNINDIDSIYAHTKVDHKEETLIEHLELSTEYLEKIIENKSLDKTIKEISKKLGFNSQGAQGFFNELLFNTIYLHDIGKVSRNFQIDKMENQSFKRTQEEDSNHALASSLIYLDYYFSKLKNLSLDKAEKERFIVILVINSYLISRHHGEVSALTGFKDKLVQKLYMMEEYSENWDLIKNKVKMNSKSIGNVIKNFEKVMAMYYKQWNSTALYIYSKLAYSLLISCDFYATSNYIEGKEIDDLGIIDDPEKMYNEYKNNDVYKHIQNYSKDLRSEIKDFNKVKEINILRSEIFLEAEENILSNIDENLFYLEAPTGSGKTNTSINLALKLLTEVKSLNKIIYVFPFNSLVEQTKNSLISIFSKDKEIQESITVLNSITPMKEKGKESEYEGVEPNYNKVVLDNQFLHYPFVLTSHVKLFNILFGTERGDICSLYQLANSVIVLDEIQSYRNDIWKEIINCLKDYADILNIKIIIMSATLPDLAKLVDEEEFKIPSLISNREKYFNNPLFKNRVEVDYSLLEVKEDVIDVLKDKVVYSAPDKKILIEFLTKKSANKFYHDLRDLKEEGELESEILLITGDDNKIEREKIIQRVKEKDARNIILVATQVVEAGVDIDMDIGFKDISILDSEEQFLGRINRSCKKLNKNGITKSKVYFFNLDSASIIYKGDYRKHDDLTLKNEEMMEVLKDKNYDKFYDKVIDTIDKAKSENNDTGLKQFLDNGLMKFDYKKIEEWMKLIKEDFDPISIFLNVTVDTKDEDGNDIEISGENIWNQYSEIITDKGMEYARRKVELSRIREKMDYFMYKISGFNKGVDFSYNQKLGSIYYIRDGEKYFTQGKFDREKISNSPVEFI